MRFVAGGLLLVMSMIVLGVLSPEGALAMALGGFERAQIFGFFAFFSGVFSMLPRFWEWRKAPPGVEPGPVVRVCQGIWTTIGVVIMLAGIVGLGGAAFLIKDQQVALSIFSGLVGLNLMAASALTLQPMWQQIQAKGPPKKNLDVNKVLRMARDHRGRITPTEIAAESTFSVHEAADILNGLARDGFCEERVSELGTSFYMFPEFASSAAKRDIFEDAEDEHVVLDVDRSSASVGVSHEARSKR